MPVVHLLVLLSLSLICESPLVGRASLKLATQKPAVARQAAGVVREVGPRASRRRLSHQVQLELNLAEQGKISGK